MMVVVVVVMMMMMMMNQKLLTIYTGGNVHRWFRTESNGEFL
jgi:hypothetical protein